MYSEDVRRSEIDRRSKLTSTDVKGTYTDLERRAGNERRIWIDRMHEIRLKFKQYERNQ